MAHLIDGSVVVWGWRSIEARGVPDAITHARSNLQSLALTGSAFGAIIDVYGACPEDLNGDGVVDGSDLGLFFSEWGTCWQPQGCAADLNLDGVVDGIDVGYFLVAWGGC